MAHVFALDHEDDLLGDVLGVVPDALVEPGDDGELDGDKAAADTGLPPFDPEAT